MNSENLKKLLDDMAGVYYPGVDLCIYHKHKEVFRYQAGYSDVENKIPVDPNAMYYLFSCSKPLTCTAALQLMERGCYLLNDPVSYYIPEFADVKVKTVSDNGIDQLVEPETPITIKHLFTMTSGINYDLNTPYIQEVRERTGGKCPTSEIVKAIAKNPLAFQPGKHYRYGLNHDVLGGLIEIWSGMPFGEYIKKNILDPCGMTNTGFKLTDEIKKKMPPMYRRFETENNAFKVVPTDCEYKLGENSEYESGGAGIISCVEDYIKFADTMSNYGISPLTGERIISKRTIDIMRTNTLSYDYINEYKKMNIGYGYGLGVRTLIDNAAGGILSTKGEFGWDGAAGSFILMDPDEELAIFMAEFTRNPYNDIVPHRITNAVYSSLDK